MTQAELFQCPDDMEEPVPCGGCLDWVELQDTRRCLECCEPFCLNCLSGLYCSICRNDTDED